MSWQDRIRPATIITPEGAKYPFEYKDVSMGFRNKTSTYEFGDQEGALVQNFGIGITNLPLLIFFSGDDYDKVANNFMLSAGLPGNFTLEHPLYGVRVIVVTAVKRNDALATRANQAAIQLTITETTVEDPPIQPPDVAVNLQELAETIGTAAKIGGYLVQAAEDLQRAINRVTAFINRVKEVFGKIVSTVASIEAAFEAIIVGIESSIAFLLGAPLQLFSAITRLLELPARALARIKDKISAYIELWSGLVGGTDADGNPIGPTILGTSQDSLNQRIEAQCMTAALVGGISSSLDFAADNSAAAAQSSAGSVQSGLGIVTPIDDTVIEIVDTGIGYVTKSDAVNDAAALIKTLQGTQEVLDQQQELSDSSPLSTRFSVDRDVTQLLGAIVKGIAGSLIALAFQLRQERATTLLNPITFLKLCFQIYGSTSNNTLDFFIATNDFDGGDLRMLQKGKEVLYYV